MIKKRLVLLLAFMMVLATISGYIYVEAQNIKGSKVNEDSVIIIGISESKLKDRYGDLSDEEIQNILDSGSELIFKSIENKESNLKSLKIENKYLDMFDIQISNSSNDK